MQNSDVIPAKQAPEVSTTIHELIHDLSSNHVDARILSLTMELTKQLPTETRNMVLPLLLKITSDREQNRTNRNILRAIGAIEQLTAFLSDNDENTVCLVIKILSNFTSDVTITDAVMGPAEIFGLWSLLVQTENPDIITAITQSLANLTCHPKVIEFMSDPEPIAKFISLMTHNMDIKNHVLCILINLANNPACKDIIRNQNGIECLIELLRTSTDETIKTKTIMVLINLSSANLANKHYLRRLNSIPSIVSQLSPTNNDQMNQCVIRLLLNLSELDINKDEIISSRGITALREIRRMDDNNTRERTIDYANELHYALVNRLSSSSIASLAPHAALYREVTKDNNNQPASGRFSPGVD